MGWEVKNVTPPKAPLHRTTPTSGLQRRDWPPKALAPISSSTTKPRNGPLASGSTPRPMPSPWSYGFNSIAHQTSTSQAWSWGGERWCRCSWVTSSCMFSSNRSKPPSPTNGFWTQPSQRWRNRGLERCRSEQISSEASTTPATDGAIADLLKDPFLSTDSDQAKPALTDVVTAMPWLSSADEPRAMPTPDTSPTPAPFPSPEPTLDPEANSDVEMANQEPEPTIEKHPSTPSSSRPRPLRPPSFWRTHGSAFNSSLKSKTPPTPLSRWG